MDPELLAERQAEMRAPMTGQKSKIAVMPPPSSPSSPSPSTLDEAFEPHFKIMELADRWHMSITKIYELFQNEPGVLKIGSRSARRRTKLSIAIPLSVARRVYDRLRVPTKY